MLSLNLQLAQYAKSRQERQAIAEMRRKKYQMPPEIRAQRAAMLAEIEAANEAERARKEAQRLEPAVRAAKALAQLGPDARDVAELIRRLDPGALRTALDRELATLAEAKS